MVVADACRDRLETEAVIGGENAYNEDIDVARSANDSMFPATEGG